MTAKRQMPGITSTKYSVSSFTLQKSRKNMATHYKTRDEKATHLELGCFSPSSGEGQSHDKTELEKDMMRERQEALAVWHLCENYEKIAPPTDVARLGESPVGWGPAATGSSAEHYHSQQLVLEHPGRLYYLRNVGREAIQFLLLGPKCLSSSHGQATHRSCDLCLR